MRFNTDFIAWIQTAKPYCSEVIHTRIIRDGDIFTAGGVSASIDLGLYFVEYLFGSDFAEVVQKNMDYPYYEIGKYEGNDPNGIQ